MSASANGKRVRRNPAQTPARHAAGSPGVYGRGVPNLDADDDFAPGPDQPWADDAIDAIDPELRHRMVSEMAYRRHGECGYEDGYDLDDWLQAAADVDHLLHNSRR